jgi:5-methylcytosine-specific restriction endonuclease McrA
MSLRRNDYREARRLARRAFHRQHGLCFWCKRPMMWGHRGGNGVCDPLTATADHVKPVWDGGQTLPGNIVAACYECNQARGQVTNQIKRGSKFTIGDDTPSSPFEVLRAQLQAEEKLDERREHPPRPLRFSGSAG